MAWNSYSSGYRYPELSGEVKKICARYGIPYESGPFGKQFYNVLKRIVKFSFPNAKEAITLEPFDMEFLSEPFDEKIDITNDSNFNTKQVYAGYLQRVNERNNRKQQANNEVDIIFSESNRKVKASTSESILVSAELNGLSPEYGCRKGICHTCKVTKQSGSVLDHNTGLESGENREEIRICVSSPLTNLYIEM